LSGFLLIWETENTAISSLHRRWTGRNERDSFQSRSLIIRCGGANSIRTADLSTQNHVWILWCTCDQCHLVVWLVHIWVMKGPNKVSLTFSLCFSFSMSHPLPLCLGWQFGRLSVA
jgi:hypothetical protein